MTEDHSKTDQSKDNATTNDLDAEYANMPTPEEWLGAQNTGKEQLYLIGIYIILLLVLAAVMHLIAKELFGTYFWLYSILPLIAVCIALYSRVRKLEVQIYGLERQFHLRKKLRKLGMRDGEWEIDWLIKRTPLYKTKIIDFKFPFISRKKDLREIYPMRSLEYEVLAWVKNHRGFTPGDVKDHFKIGYAQATHAIDILYTHGYVSQPAFTWQKGKIRYTGEQMRSP